jgi:hypothetical protein
VGNSSSSASSLPPPPPPSLTPISSLTQKPQVPSQTHQTHSVLQQKSISNHLPQQVPNNIATSLNKSINNRVTNHQPVVHYNTGPLPNSSGYVTGPPLQTDGQQQQPQHNNDNLFEGLEDADDINLLTYLNDELPSQLLSSMLDP